MTSSVEVTNPQRRRIDTRQLKHSEWWDTREWKSFLSVHITTDSTCSRCGLKEGEVRKSRQGYEKTIQSGKHAGEPDICHLTIHHRTDEKYLTFEEYLTWDSDCVILCTRCHWMGHNRGKVICPVCRINYIPAIDGPEMCRDCHEDRTPGARERRLALEQEKADNTRLRANTRSRNKRDKQRKAAHPCLKRGLEQRCLRGSGMVCEYPAKKALDEKKGCPWLKKNPQWVRVS